MTKGSRFLGSEFPPVTPADALFHVIPVPFEKTTSFGKGAARGPAALIHASQQLEAFNGTDIPGEQGIFTAPTVNCSGSASTVIGRIVTAVSTVLKEKKVPVVIGGEHTVSIGAVAACKQHVPSIGVIQFDAHADLRDSYDGTSLSHACVMRRIVEMDVPLLQIGVRALCIEEDEFRKKRGIPFRDAAVIAEYGVPPKLVPASFPKDIYITFDVDAFDPSVVTATGCPVPGGLSWYQALLLLEYVAEGRRVCGFDVVELAPRIHDHASAFTAAQLVYEIMGIVTRNGARRSKVAIPS